MLPLFAAILPLLAKVIFQKKNFENNPKNQVASEHGGDEFKTWPVKAGAWVEQSHVSRFFLIKLSCIVWIVTPHVIIPQYHPLVNKSRDFLPPTELSVDFENQIMIAKLLFRERYGQPQKNKSQWRSS